MRDRYIVPIQLPEFLEYSKIKLNLIPLDVLSGVILDLKNSSKDILDTDVDLQASLLFETITVERDKLLKCSGLAKNIDPQIEERSQLLNAIWQIQVEREQLRNTCDALLILNLLKINLKTLQNELEEVA